MFAPVRHLFCEPGKTVRIERSRDLVHWEFAGQMSIPASGQTMTDPMARSEPQLFYRAVSVRKLEGGKFISQKETKRTKKEESCLHPSKVEQSSGS